MSTKYNKDDLIVERGFDLILERGFHNERLPF